MQTKNGKISDHLNVFVKKNGRHISTRASQASKEKTACGRKTRERRRKCFGDGGRKRIWAVESENGKWVTRTRRSPCIGDDDDDGDGERFARRTFHRTFFPRDDEANPFHLASAARRKFSARDFGFRLTRSRPTSFPAFAFLVEKLDPASIPIAPSLKSRYADSIFLSLFID